jgi:hypothetical protein
VHDWFGADATEPDVTDARRVGASKPGPKGGETSVADFAWQAALKVLADDNQRPPPGCGRLIKPARLVNAELAKQGHTREDYSIRKAIGPGLREWEAQNPDKQQTRMRPSG